MEKKDYSKTRFQDIPKEDRKQVYKDAREKGMYKDNKSISTTSKNLIPLTERSKEEQLEIRRKGAMALNKLKGEKKNAKQILDTLLPLYANDNAIESNECIPLDIKKEILKKNIKITQYDLIMLSQIYQAQSGNVKSAEFVANHYGDIVTKEVNIKDSMSDADRELIKNISKRVGLDNVIDID